METHKTPGNAPLRIRCVMTEDCQEKVTHIDQRGFVYCEHHGLRRRASGTPCRKMTGKEIKFIYAGQLIKGY